MTITIFIKKENLLSDLSIIKMVINAGNPDAVEQLSKSFEAIDCLQYLTPWYQVALNLTPEEFALIMIFNKGKFSYD